jgi:hypothetical protein
MSKIIRTPTQAKGGITPQFADITEDNDSVIIGVGWLDAPAYRHHGGVVLSALDIEALVNYGCEVLFSPLENAQDAD